MMVRPYSSFPSIAHAGAATLVACVVAVALAASFAMPAAPALAGCGVDPTQTARDLSTQSPTGLPSALPVLALSDDPRIAQDACTKLRAEGPTGLEALFEAYPEVLAKGASDPRWPAFSAALDRVSGQRDDFASRLYWYTDMEQARQAAKASGRPILSLRIPGRLDGDPAVPGMNARMFRTALYADPDVARILASRYVLHWQSGALPTRVAIELGDGESIDRPLQGTSAHFVLDGDGRILDVLPGVEGAPAFRGDLLTEAQLERSLRGLQAGERAQRLVRFHGLRRAVQQGEWPGILG